MKAKDKTTGQFKKVYVKAMDALPVGTELDFDGSLADLPEGWVQVENPEEYLPTEVKTNKTWIDGKPIYRKVFTQNNVTLSTSGVLIGNIGSDVSTWVSSYLRVGNIDGNGVRSGRTGYLNSDYHSGIQLSIDGNIRLFAKDGEATKAYVLLIMEYTKTTD